MYTNSKPLREGFGIVALCAQAWACPNFLDTDFLNLFMGGNPFEVHRGLITQSAVEPFWVIEGFDVIKDGRAGGLALGGGDAGGY